jgi:eukaryotic-like serine/threonine-protein kinase
MSTLSPEQWQKVSPYLDQALTLSDQERERWLADLRMKDPALARQISALLDNHYSAQQEGFLETSPPLPSQSKSLAGETVGPYRLLSEIGRGGMGMVWLAERSDGRFQRRAAVKFLSVGLGGRGGAERFKREGAILGRLSHPNIAELLDAGVTPAAQPYLVLEYVDGEPIDRYCKHKKLDIQQRCRLFLDVLAAVAHAHANLIIHRDIKPSNVLVNRDGQVKLLDFGIAKLLEGEGSDGSATLLTHEAGSALMPEHAAPEQVMGVPVTTATDVYGLGVLFYGLLTEKHPAGLGVHTPAGLVKAIVDTEPQRMSEVVADRLRRQLQGDLDTIVAKALKKDPRERYASVTTLADDVNRYLRTEPISARPDTVVYRVKKFVGRNRLVVGLATVALLAVIAGVVGILVQAQTARRQRDLAFRERDRANRITSFMTDMFKLADPAENAAKDVTAREVLDKTAKDIDSGLAKDPQLRAQMMQVMGGAYMNLGQYKQAEALLRRAVELSRGNVGSNAPETLSLMDFLGSALAQQGSFPEAEKLQRQVLESQTRVLGPEHPDTLSTMGDLGSTLAMGGHFAEAEKLLRETLEKQRRVLGTEDHHTIATMDDLAATLGEEGRFAESVELERETIELERRVYGPDHLGVLMSMGNEADPLYSMGRFAEAQQLLQQAREIQLRVLGPNHPETARAAYNLGCIAAVTGKRDEAFKFLNEAIEGLSPIRIPDVKGDPAFDSLRGDARFAVLVTRTKQRGSGDARCPL